MQTIINDVRLELTDEQATRWTDAQLLLLVGKAIRRANTILFRNDIEIGRKVTTVTTAIGTDTYALPADFGSPYGLYRDGNNTKITQESEDSWALLNSPSELTSWLKRGDNLILAGVPTSVETLTLVYWPFIDTSAFTVGTASLWGGKLDDLVAEYAALRAKNIDEMDASVDAQLLQDLENNILDAYAGNDPTIVTKRGWLVN